MSKKPKLGELQNLLSGVEKARVQGAFLLIHIEEVSAIKALLNLEIDKLKKREKKK